MMTKADPQSSSKDTSKSDNKTIADDPTYNQPQSDEDRSEKNGDKSGTIVDDPTYNQPSESDDSGTEKKKPADSRSKL